MASIIIYIMMYYHTYTIHFFFFLSFVSLLFHVPLLLRKLEDCCSIRSTEFIKIVCTVFTKPDILNRISHVQKRYIVYVFKKYYTNAFIRPTYSSRHIVLRNVSLLRLKLIFLISNRVYRLYRLYFMAFC